MKLLISELNLWLDSYDDIYSDFDSRHYLKRRMSEDFLYELRTELKYQEQHIGDLILLLPQDKRREPAEKIIANSLGQFFLKQHRIQTELCRQKLRQGTSLLLIGFILMLLSSWITYRATATLFSFPVVVLRVLLEPAGWFLSWTAFDFLIYDFAAVKKERDLFKMLSDMHIHFKAA